MGCLALLPQIIKAVKLPVIAAGGISTAAAVSAAKALGANAVQVGTAFLTSDEATTSALHRQALMSDAAKHTALTNLFSGRPARGIVNKFMRDFGPLNPEAPAFPLATAAVAPLRSAAEAKGQSENKKKAGKKVGSIVRESGSVFCKSQYVHGINRFDGVGQCDEGKRCSGSSDRRGICPGSSPAFT